MRVRHTAPLLLAAVVLALSGCTAPPPEVVIERAASAQDPHDQILSDLAKIKKKLGIEDEPSTPAPTTSPTTPPATSTVAPAPPTTTTTAAPAPPGTVPVGSRVVYAGDFNTGDFRQWTQCQWKGRNSGCGSYPNNAYHAKVQNGGPGHETAARFEVRRGDVPPFGGGERAEVTAPDIADVREGDERWYEFSLKFDETYRPPTKGGYSIVMQWHAGSGSPPMHLDVNERGELIVWHPWDNPRVIGPIDPGQWHSYVVHAKFSRSASVGFVEVYRDGKIAVPKTFRANMKSASNYLKMGLYRDTEAHTQVVWHDGLRITAP